MVQEMLIRFLPGAHFIIMDSYGLSLMPVWITEHTPNKVWAEIIYPLQNFNAELLGMDK